MSGTMTDELALSTLNALRNWLPIHGAEIEAAQHALDHVTQQLARITALEESTHYANGCADLAMKHRDIAEAEAGRLAQPAAAVPEAWLCEFDNGGWTSTNVVFDADTARAEELSGAKVTPLYAQALASSPPAQVAVPDGWRELMAELADDVEADIESRRHSELPRRIERDLKLVRRARAMLTSAPEPPK